MFSPYPVWQNNNESYTFPSLVAAIRRTIQLHLYSGISDGIFIFKY